MMCARVLRAKGENLKGRKNIAWHPLYKTAPLRIVRTSMPPSFDVDVLKAGHSWSSYHTNALRSYMVWNVFHSVLDAGYAHTALRSTKRKALNCFKITRLQSAGLPCEQDSPGESAIAVNSSGSNYHVIALYKPRSCHWHSFEALAGKVLFHPSSQ